MDELQKPSFYEALKNAQPLAFLASFSMVIGILAFSNNDLISIRQDAIVAGFMFIFSFVMSLISQLFGRHNYGLNQLAKYTIYFFLAVGIFHWLLIAITFSSEILKIPKLLGAWIFFLLGGGIFVRAYTAKIHPAFKNDKFLFIYHKLAPGLAGFGMLFMGIIFLFIIFTNYELPFDWPWVLYIGLGIGLPGIALLVISEFVLSRRH